MKLRKHILSLAFLMSVSTLAFAQSLDLTLSQMQEDFDELVTFYQDIAVHQQLNAVRLGIDYNREFTALRKTIKEQMTPCDFQEVLEKVTRLIQDQHSSSMSYNYLSQYGKYQTKLNFKEADGIYEKVRAYEALCPAKKKVLVLPIIFTKGNYQVYAGFEYQNVQVSEGSQIRSVNGQSIESFIGANMDRVWPVKVDALGDKYNEKFYRVFDEPFELSIEKNGELQSIVFDTSKEVKLSIEEKREITYYSQEKPQIHYFDDQKILYIGLPMMDTNFSSKLIKQIDSLKRTGVSFEKIAIDIRGNPGGNDMTWRNLLSRLTNETISFKTNIKFNDNATTAAKYGRKDQASESAKLLNGASFWTDKPVTIKIKPSKKSLMFEGDIYVLQDEYIYSSAGNFSNVCLLSDKLISVGRRTDLVGGLQKEPLFYRLKHSGLVFRSEPILDFSNVSQVSDFAHNKVEVEIPITMAERRLRATYPGDIYGKEYLLTKDPIFGYVLKQ